MDGKKKRKKKKFQPIFAPSYVSVIGIDEQERYIALPIVRKIEYGGGEMRIYVRL